jgi:hypothetical protein
MMNKIFQIGFNRCATQSLTGFFADNGILSIHNTKHGEEGNPLANKMKANVNMERSILHGYEEYGFYSDMECSRNSLFAYAEYYEQLDKQYPDSRFILNIRSVDSWISSRARLVKGQVIRWAKKQYNVKTKEEVFEKWREHYHTHVNNVKLYFKDRPTDLLVFDIEQDSISKLIKFFERDISLNPQYWKVTNQRGPEWWN